MRITKTSSSTFLSVFNPYIASACCLPPAAFRLFRFSTMKMVISAAKVMIQESYMDISPEEIASRLCLSYSSFRKTFKEYTGFSPARYINEVRMSKAKELLTNTSMSIKEVAFHVGYNNHDYFFTAFRHVTGRTPAEYRAMTQGTSL